MGYSLSWAAVKNSDLQTICAALDLSPKGKREEIAESKFNAVQLPNGWWVILFDHAEIEDSTLEKLSKLGEVVSCFVEDHVMFSSASGWLGSKQTWKLLHDCEKGRYHLEAFGDPPSALADIRKRLTEKQHAAGGEKADVDYIYETPAELAKALTGFRHDEEIRGTARNAYYILESTIDSNKSLVARVATVFKGSSTSSLIGLVALMVLFSPVLLVAALIAVPWILAARLVGRLVQKWRSQNVG